MINWDEVDKISQQHGKLNLHLAYGDKINCYASLEEAHIHRGDLLEFVNQFRPHPFDPDDLMTCPEMETEVLVNLKCLGWKIAKLCYSVMFKNPAWKTDNKKLDYTAGIEWQPLPPIGKEGEG